MFGSTRTFRSNNRQLVAIVDRSARFALAWPLPWAPSCCPQGRRARASRMNFGFGHPEATLLAKLAVCHLPVSAEARGKSLPNSRCQAASARVIQQFTHMYSCTLLCAAFQPDQHAASPPLKQILEETLSSAWHQAGGVADATLSEAS